MFTRDTLTVDWRDALARWATRDGDWRNAFRSYVHELLTCPLCLGVWVSGAVYSLWRWCGPGARALVVVLAVAGVQCALALVEIRAFPDEDDK